MTDFNGWANEKTFLVVETIMNDEGIYNAFWSAVNVDGYRHYESIVKNCLDEGETTFDGVRFDDPDLCIQELDDLVADLYEP